MFDPYAGFQSRILGNGLKVYASQWEERPWEYVGFVVHSGAFSDPIGLEGLAHFVEHLVSQNVDLTSAKLREFFERNGGRVNLGLTSYSTTSYEFFVPIRTEVLAQAFSLFGGMLIDAKLKNHVERERMVVTEEIAMKYPTAFSLEFAKRQQRVLHHDCWLSRFIRPFGLFESVDRITVADLQAYYDRYYVPANISVVAVGGLSLNEVISIIAESPFGTQKVGQRNLPIVPLSELAFPLENRYEVDLSKYLNTAPRNGTYGSSARLPKTINTEALSLAANVLDKILSRELREKRAWTYNVGSGLTDYSCCYELKIGCDAFSLSALNEIEAVVNDCIMAIDNNELLEEMRTRKLAKCLMMDVSGGVVFSSVMEDVTSYDKIISLQEVVESYQSVTIDDIREILSYLRPERRWTVISHP